MELEYLIDKCGQTNGIPQIRIRGFNWLRLNRNIATLKKNWHLIGKGKQVIITFSNCVNPKHPAKNNIVRITTVDGGLLILDQPENKS